MRKKSVLIVLFIFVFSQSIFSQLSEKDLCFKPLMSPDKLSHVNYQLVSHGKNEYEVISEVRSYPNKDQKDPGSVTYTHVWLNLGFIYRDWNVGDRAVEAFKKSIQMSQHEDVYYSLGLWYKISGQLDKALLVWKQGFERHSKSTKLCSALYKTYYDKGMYEKAEKYAEEAIRTDPTEKSSRFNLGLIYKGMRKYQKAAEVFKDELKLNPNHCAVYEQLGHLYSVELDDYAQSIRFNAEAVELGSQNACTYNDLAWYSMVIAQNSSKVLAWAQKGVELDPENKHCQGTLAWAYYKNAMYDQSLETFKKMGNHLHSVDYFGLGLTYLKAGKKIKAKALIRKAFRMNSQMENDDMMMIESERADAEEILGKSLSELQA